MKKTLLHTPDGFRDIYNEDCEGKLELESSLRRVLYGFGYRAIETPSVEFAEIFAGSEGGVSEKELYRFFDRDGSTMALRPDFTPSVARSAAKYYSLEEPVRLCYLGQTFVNHSSYKGMLKETTQLGAELMGDATADADAEVLATVISCLKAAGLQTFQLTVGHAGYFNSLVREADGSALLTDMEEETLKNLIRNRNSLGVRDYLAGLSLEQDRFDAIAGLPELFGGRGVLESAKAAISGPAFSKAAKAREAIERLEQVCEILKLYGLEEHITFDLAMLGNYMYYTGIIFRGYTYGTGDAIVKGGRYDNLLEQFGKVAPATGFVIVIDQLLEALQQQGIRIHSGGQRSIMTCTKETRAEAIRDAMERRARGEQVEMRYR